MDLQNIKSEIIIKLVDDISNITKKLWLKPADMVKDISNIVISNLNVKIDKIQTSGETDNICVYIISSNILLAVSPLYDLKKNILLKRWKPNWSDNIKEIIHYKCFEIDNELLENLSMPKVLLINLCVIENFPIPRLNLSTGVIASYLRKMQIADVYIIDMQVGVTIAEIIRETQNIKPDIIGLSISFGQKKLAIKLIEKLYEDNNNAFIVIGNIIPSLYPEDFIEKFPQSIVSYGEGEVTFPHLIKYIKNEIKIEEIDGIIYKDVDTGLYHKNDKTAIDLKEVPLPALDTLKDISNLKGALTLETSRGCDYSKCTFCPRQHKLSNWRYMTSEQTLDQINKLIVAGNALGIIPHIYFADEEFIGELPNSMETNRVINICEGIIKNEIKLKFDTSARADSVYDHKRTDEWNIDKIKMWHMCKLAGLDRLFVGVESGCSSQLVRYGKGTTVEQNVIALRILTALGIHIRIGFVMFDPLMEEFNDLRENLEFLERSDAILKPIDLNTISYDELLYKLVYDQDYIKQNSLNRPIYTVVSYMLASLEILVGSPYIKMVKNIEYRTKKTLVLNNNKPDANMGRYIVKYVDNKIGVLSIYCQKWIDSNFSIMYILKSLYKVENIEIRQRIYDYMIRYREMSQYLLRFLINNLEIDNTEDYYLLAYLEKEGIIGEFNKMKELADMDINNIITNSMNFWQYIMNNMIKEIKNDLKYGHINDTYDKRLQDSINNWYKNVNKWSLINEADNYN